MPESTAEKFDLPAARRSARPERIDLGNGDVAVRNDVIAKEEGRSERALNEEDADGAPFLYISKVKYRPIAMYRAYLVGKTQVRNQRRGSRAIAKTAGRP